MDAPSGPTNTTRYKNTILIILITVASPLTACAAAVARPTKSIIRRMIHGTDAYRKKAPDLKEAMRMLPDTLNGAPHAQMFHGDRRQGPTMLPNPRTQDQAETEWIDALLKATNREP